MEKHLKPLLEESWSLITNNMSLKSKLLIFFTLLQLSACSASLLKADESVWFFPTSANQISDNEWNVPIHHWVFEKEERSLTRNATQKLLSEAIEGLGVSEEDASSPVVHQRLMWFLVDNQRNKKINIDLNKRTILLNKTAPNGHAITSVNFKTSQKSGDWVSFVAIDPTKNARQFSGMFQLIPKTGLSVISDIDDTIKVSNVLDKKALLKNTFVKPYQVTKGFPEYYRSLEKQGVYFHYVSASPWQIQPSLKGFMDKNYPAGTISLRNFRIKDSSILSFLKPSTEYKIAQIKSIIERYPEHQFMLIGDSGEHDPEVYATIYQQYPKKIKSIMIRAVDGSDLSNKRFETTFKGIPSSSWRVSKIP